MSGVTLDYRAILQEFEDVPNDTRLKAEHFLSPAAAGRRYLLGRNEHSLALSRVIEIDGFVDDYAREGERWQDKPVIKIADLSAECAVVNCSMSISPVSALARLKSSRCGSVLNYADLYRAVPQTIPLPAFVQSTRDDYRLHEARLLNVFEHLADEPSRVVMRALAAYRLTGDPGYMMDFRVRFSEQYFENFLDLTNAVFVDAGGFDGDTTEEFCKRYPGYKKIFLFEPSRNNIEAARKRLSNCRDIEFVQLGLSDSVGSLRFNPDAGSASAVTTEGTVSIEVTTLDRFTDERVSFIKMDLEGWELKALRGAARHILIDRPALAISVYHNPSDFWQIYEYVASIHNDYMVYLRHYTEGWSETVMFFVPR